MSSRRARNHKKLVDFEKEFHHLSGTKSHLHKYRRANVYGAKCAEALKEYDEKDYCVIIMI